MKFNDYILELTNGLIGSTNDVTYSISKNEPIKKEIKKVYKKQQKLSKAVVIYKPKLNFEKDK